MGAAKGKIVGYAHRDTATRRPLRRWLACVVPLAVGLLALPTAASATASTSAPYGGVAQAASTVPTTTAQCKKRYKAGTKSRAACIKRVNKPGSSCAHPLESMQGAYGPVGDKADFTVELGQYESEALPFTPVQVNAVVTLHSSRVVICPKLMIQDYHPGSSGTPPRYYATVGPEGGASSTITAPFGIFTPTAYARLK